jgi:phosphatidylethanolamine/phosphatidyl-N-methylethanolamine N-methyltransferase
VADLTNGNGLREHVLLLSRFLRNPRRVGALAPSSRALAHAMVADLPSNAPVVVELGPGTGAFTGAIVDRLGPEARFLAVDIEPAFVKSICQRWPSVECVLASAEHLEALLGERRLDAIDHVISGLPFASLPLAMTRRILDSLARTLRLGGTFTTFQYAQAYGFKSARLFRSQMNERMGDPPHRHLVWKNFPPAYVLTWTRRTSSSATASAPVMSMTASGAGSADTFSSASRQRPANNVS